MTELTVREATPADIGEIRRITELGWNAAYSEILSEDVIDAAMAAFDPEATRESVETDEVGYFVAERDETVVGYLNGGPSQQEGVAVLGSIYVEPDYWGEGTGTALLRAFEEFCRRRGIETIKLKVIAGNTVGISFYRKHGYEERDRRENDLFGETVSELIFSTSVE